MENFDPITEFKKSKRNRNEKNISGITHTENAEFNEQEAIDQDARTIDDSDGKRAGEDDDNVIEPEELSDLTENENPDENFVTETGDSDPIESPPVQALPSNNETDPPENEGEVDIGDKESEIQYPEGWTKEPRDEEEADSGLFKTQEAFNVYRGGSDNRGDYINDPPLYTQTKQYYIKNQNLDAKNMENPEMILQETKELITRFGTAINVSENTNNGVVTKYRLWMGKILLIQQTAAKKAGYVWKIWFQNNYDKSFFRSAEDYMRLAKVPEIIRYFVFGKERLLGIIRLIDDLDTKDPVGEFLQKNGLSFDPLTETDPVEIRRQADIAVNYKKLADAGITGITRDQIETYVRNGKEIEKRQIEFLKAGDDVKVQMEKLIASDGKVEPIMTPERNAEIFKNATTKLIESLDKAFEDAAYITAIDAATYNNLKQKMLNLEPLINPTN